jgi:hypothetical protein
VREENPRVALDRIRGEIETDDALSRSCHSLVHEVGREAHEKYGDFGEAMKYRDDLCNSGYLHGIIESKFSQSEDVFADMKAMCGRYEPGRYMSWQCYHGIGHGAMFYTSNDLPRSLEMCDGFEDVFGRSSCANGVFMENFNTEQKAHVSKYLKESDPFYPCAEQAERHKADCYLYAPTYFLDLEGDDYTAAPRVVRRRGGRLRTDVRPGRGEPDDEGEFERSEARRIDVYAGRARADGAVHRGDGRAVRQPLRLARAGEGAVRQAREAEPASLQRLGGGARVSVQAIGFRLQVSGKLLMPEASRLTPEIREPQASCISLRGGFRSTR